MKIYLAENIKKFRKEHSLTQEQLAEALGVTAGAVYKWESGQSMPEIKLLVEIAEFFETSIDVLLGYGWEKGNLKNMMEEAYQHLKTWNFEAAIKVSEKALKKYPNSFEAVYNAAMVYRLSALPDKSRIGRAIELFLDCKRLIDQNTHTNISRETIDTEIALCYQELGKIDKAIEILKKSNANGINEHRIGLLLSTVGGRADEALEHLAEALGISFNKLFYTCMGYANAYIEKQEYEKLKSLLLCFYNFGQGLRDTNNVSYIDRSDIRILTILSAVANAENDISSAKDYLHRALALAERFDNSPNYKISSLYFYYGWEDQAAFDKMGDTAKDVIINYINENSFAKALLPVWEEIYNEQEG